MSRTHRVVDHPIVQGKITRLREESTPPDEFRVLVRSLGGLLCYEALRELPAAATMVRTPLDWCAAAVPKRPVVIAVVLRAALAMADGALDLVPTASVAHIGVFRDERSLEPQPYYFKTPPNLEEAETLLVDPMLATGGSVLYALQRLREQGARHLQVVSIIGSRPGVARVAEAHPDIPITLGALDETLNDHGFIHPGLGDAGDRTYGTG